MNQLKRILCFLLAAMMLFALAACGGEETTAPSEDKEALAEAARNTIAITIGDHNLNAVEVNYYYVETINNFINQYSAYISYFMDVTKPLDQQKCTLDETKTWAQYFMSIAQDNMKSTYMLCDLAAQNGYTLPENERAYLGQMKSAIEQYATYYKYESANAYLVDVFGYGADMDSYLAYTERALLADSYYAYYAENLSYDDATLREYEAKEPHMYNSYSYVTYYLACSKFLTGGSEGADGNKTYTDEQKAAAVEAATEAANALLSNTCTNVDEFKAMILGMEVHADLDSVAVKENTDVFFNSADKFFQEWFKEEERTIGQLAVIPKVSSVDDGEVIEGYYILWFSGINDNKFAMKDVRHLLVLFKDANGKTFSDGVKTFTDEQKATAKATADALLAQWLDGDADEVTFSALATLKSEDEGSKLKGGLYQNIYPGQMVTNFENWCYDETRVPGDYGIVETEYGYHLMYFVGNTEMNYRDYIITNVMRKEDIQKWHDDLLAAAVLTEVNLEFCELDMVLSG